MVVIAPMLERLSDLISVTVRAGEVANAEPLKGLIALDVARSAPHHRSADLGPVKGMVALLKF